MPLATGTRVGPYEIVSPLGAGGMGEVYRARDARLKRDVAIKVLPASVVANAERLARFQREAQVIASLNHPQIAAIYGLEGAEGAEALVMELVDGETLAERIARGAIPPQEAVSLARHIAEGLEYAHDRSIVHRDLKPANVMVTPEGRVKILDFGLAKALESGVSDAGPDITSSPTVTGGATREGVILGTAAYMSPEQARGKPADKRADVWAFGCVLYEMLAGRNAFRGANVTDTLASVVRDEPDWTALPRDAPPSLRRLLERCLVKDSTRRLQAIGDARVELEEIAEAFQSGPAGTRPTGATPGRRGFGRRAVWVSLAAVLLLGVLFAVSRRTSRATPPVPVPPAPGTAGSAAPAQSSSAMLAHSSLAVLPFRNLSGDSANDYFSDGISEEILNALTRLPGLKVIGRTSSFRFRGTDVDAHSVGRQLGVGVILSGSVQKAADAVRVTAELVDAGTGYQLWSQKYDRKLQNLFELEDEISHSIADALRVQLAGGETKPLVAAATSSPEAHNLFLRAKALASHPDEASLNQALRLYQDALVHDPHYAPAWSGIADVYVWLGDAYRAPREVLPLGREAAQKSIAIDDSLAAGHMALGTMALIWEWNFPMARAELERALAMDPGVGMTHAYYALLLLTADRDYARARGELEKAASLDPLNPFVPFYRLILASGERDFPEALRQAARVREIEPDFFYLLSPMALAHMSAGRWADCVADYRDLPESVRRQPQHGLAICLARLGDENQAREILGRIEAESRTRYIDAALIATVYGALGRRDEAFAWLDRAYGDRSGGLLLMDCWPDYESLRSDPRYAALRTRVGLPAEKGRSR